MKEFITILFSVLLFIFLVLGTFTLQAHLKFSIQILTFSYAVITLGTLFIRRTKLTSILFYVLLGYVTFINIFILTTIILDVINPNDGTVFIDGKVRRVMHTNWITGFVLALVISPILVWQYHKKIKRDKITEIVFNILYIIIAALVIFSELAWPIYD